MDIGTFDIEFSVLLLHCIVGPYVVFILYMMFHINAGYDNDDVQNNFSDVTDVGCSFFDSLCASTDIMYDE